MLKKYQQNKTPFILSLLITVMLSVLYLSDDPISNNIIKRINAFTYDIRIKQTVEVTDNDDLPPVIIVDIDEYSLNKEGRWPWSRHKLATLVEALHQANAAVITFDIGFSEPERNPASAIQELLTQQSKPLPSWFQSAQKQLDPDQKFSQSLSGKSVVLGYHFNREERASKGSLHLPIIQTTANIDKLTALHMSSYIANLKKFTKTAAGSGFFITLPDDDGTLRKAPILIEHNGKLYPSLALETVRQYYFEDKINLYTTTTKNAETISHIKIGNKKVYTDAKGQVLIPYQKDVRRFPIISASSILHNETLGVDLDNAIVLIGTSAAGLFDLRSTPVNPALAGVKIQAALVDGLLHPKDLIYTPEWADGATFIELMLLGLFMMLLYPLVKHYSLVIIALLLITVSVGFKLWLWEYPHINLGIFIPVLQIIAISITYIIFRMLHENAQRKRIHNIFGHYVPVEHINSIMECPSNDLLSGQRREMSVLFSDIRDFTSLSEHLTSQHLRQFLNRYLTPVTKIIFQHNGTIDKYVGDMVMAFWGAPLRDKYHAQNAVLAALDIQQLIVELQNEFKDLNLSFLSAGIGIHTGEMNVGDMGSDYRRAYTVLGDAVNLGSRLESLTKYYGINTLVSEDTCKACTGITFRYIDHIRVKGRQQAVRVFEPIGLNHKLTIEQEEFLKQHRQAFSLYLSCNWKTSRQQFSELSKQTQDPLYRLYIKRAGKHLEDPPKDWDEIYEHQQK